MDSTREGFVRTYLCNVGAPFFISVFHNGSRSLVFAVTMLLLLQTKEV